MKRSRAGGQKGDAVPQRRTARRRGAAWAGEQPVKPPASSQAGTAERLRDREDISERKKAEEALREANDRNELVLAGAGAGIWDWDMVRHEVHFSSQWKAMRGFAENELGRAEAAWSDGIHPEDKDRVLTALRVHLEGRTEFFDEEYRVQRKDGSWIWVADRGLARRDSTGRVVRMAGSETDITKRKHAEEALRVSEARLAQAVRLARLGTFDHDHVRQVIEVSAETREIYGFGQVAQATVRHFVERIAPEDRERVVAAIRHAHDPNGDGHQEVEHRIEVPGRGTRWVSLRAQSFFEGEGSERRVVRTIGAVLDVTERKEAEAVLERVVSERTAKLQEMVGELEHFSYSITHDMRAPLRGMQGFAELMAAACAGCEKQDPQGFLRRILVSAGRMDALITDALNYNRAVRQELTLEPVDAGALLRGMLDSYPELQPARANVEIRGEIPLVMANPAGLTQCFSNLLGNAVKFVKPGHKPQIRIWAEFRDERARSSQSPSTQRQVKGEWVMISIADKGIGVPAVLLPRVFDMFSRGHATYEGTGIGLALVRKVVKRMGGRVGVESEEGQGSRFWLELRSAE